MKETPAVKRAAVITFLAGTVIFASCSGAGQASAGEMQADPMSTPPLDTATFAAGCFWCVEAIFEELEGVYFVTSGYSGGKTANPTYGEVCSGLTGHAEVCQIGFDPATISFEDLLGVFWQTHDPTTLDKQGADVGTQYRSAIFYHDDEQRRLAEHFKEELNNSGAWDKPVVTEISPFITFYPAENDHQNYYAANSGKPYCTYVIQPKLEKFRKVFGERLKK